MPPKVKCYPKQNVTKTKISSKVKRSPNLKFHSYLNILEITEYARVLTRLDHYTTDLVNLNPGDCYGLVCFTVNKKTGFFFWYKFIVSLCSHGYLL